jgi:NitT/TauT family transport system ATP-binding protein
VYVSDRIILLSPRPGRVSEIIDPDIPKGIGPDELRRNDVYLRTVEDIWHGIKKYVE